LDTQAQKKDSASRVVISNVWDNAKQMVQKS
jgi:hypothetical protein